MGAVKTQDIPGPLREWWKHFQVAAYRHDYIRVFDDFVTMTLTQFVHPHERFTEWHEQAMKPYDRKEKDAFNAMFFEVIRIMDEQVNKQDKKYYDCFGTMYETLSSNYKKSALGQFFTPEEVVEMLCLMQLKDIEPGAKKRILDPCSGSGRMLFIAHAHAPGNFTYAIDIDHLCAKMSAINMMFHGCVGEVVCGNGLFLDQDWRWAVAVNPILTHHGVPSLMYIEKEASWIWRQEQQQIASFKQKISAKPEKISTIKKKVSKAEPVPAVEAPPAPPGSQLKIFDL